MADSTQGQTLQLHYVDGDPDGLLTAEVFNWTGHVLAAPRARIAEALHRREAKYGGAYLLMGRRHDGPDPAYIGESDNMSGRIGSYETDKAWWTRAFLVTSKDGGLNTTYSRYLESRLHETASDVGRVSLKNKIMPKRPVLGEADRSYMDGFLHNLFMVFPAVGVDAFKQSVRPDPPDASLPAFELVLPEVGLRARAVIENGEFVVLKGSQARGKWVGVPHAYEKLHSCLIEKGVLKREGKVCVFTKDHGFSSVSAAAAVVRGMSTPGPDAWKCEGDGRSYKAWKEGQSNKNTLFREAGPRNA